MDPLFALEGLFLIADWRRASVKFGVWFHDMNASFGEKGMDVCSQ